MTSSSSFLFFLFLLAFLSLTFIIATAEDQHDIKSNPKYTDTSKLLFSSVFLSCNKHNGDQSYWNKIPRAVIDKAGLKKQDEWKRDVQNHKIDALVWLGDAVYNDRSPLPAYWLPSPTEEMRRKYTEMRNNANYSKFIQNHLKKQDDSVIGVYDDHDYGENDGGKSYPNTENAQQLFLDFLGASKTDKVRRTLRKGVYNFQKFSMSKGNKKTSPTSPSNVCFALLDVRYHRDDPVPSGEGDILGEDQWRWLETVLVTGTDLEQERERDPELKKKKSTTISEVQKVLRDRARARGVYSIDDECAVTFIGSGTQIISDEKPSESWGMFPHSRNRLLKLLAASGARKLVLLSGDVHLGEIFRLWKRYGTRKTKFVDENGVEREHDEVYTLPAKESESPFSRFYDPSLRAGPQLNEEHQALWEVTSSGLTHDSSSLVPNGIYDKIFPNSQRRFENAILMKNFGVIRVFAKNPTSEDVFTPENIKVEISLHSVTNGFEQHWITPKFRPLPREIVKGYNTELLIEKDFAQFPEIRYFHLETNPAPITQLVLGIQKRLAPSLSRHKVIFCTIVCAFVGLIGGVLLVAVIVRRVCCGGGGRGGTNRDDKVEDKEKLKKE